MKKRQKSLSSALSLFFIVFLSVILIIAVSLVSALASQTFESSYVRQSKVAMTGMQDTVKGYESSVEEAGKKLAGNLNLIQAVGEKNNFSMTDLLKTQVSTNGLSYAFLTDENGKLISSSTSDFDLPEISKLNHVQTALKGRATTVYEVITGKDLCVCYGVPLKNGDTLIGTVSTVISLANITQSLDHSTFVDKLKSYTGCEFTVFLNDERINTTLQVNKKRETGTKMGAAVVEKVLKQKQNYTGKTEILGQKMVANYVPITGADGKAVGALFTGVNIEESERQLSSAVLFSFGIAVILIVFATVILYRFMRKRVKNPLNQVVALANNMEHGEIGISNADAVALTVHTRDEVGQVASALENTVTSLQTYIGEISGMLSSISEGDLTVEAQREYYGDFSQIKIALNHIVRSLNSVFYDIGTAAQSVSDRSDQISSSAAALSQGASEQAATSEQLSATITEISGQIQKTAQNAEVASTIAKQSTDEVERGNRNIEEMLTAMNNINDASAEIRKITKTIEDIAFQTNILALNAAVEAARAGAAGKGFSVVADEVRNLAGKSANAAQQTAALIENTIGLVENGTKVASSTAASFQQIRTSSNKSTALISEISEATRNEAAAVEQVTTGIDQIARVVQENSAASEENAAVSRDLSEQSRRLRDLAGRFRLKGSAKPNTAQPEKIRLVENREPQPEQPTHPAHQVHPVHPKSLLGEKY
ncbi:MAG TPA: methyl-accepting chemotaxis protein [Caproiciproducens sp.]|nr:methyl-accepting chemotaxis protein [Caproiciproducens sp.]